MSSSLITFISIKSMLPYYAGYAAAALLQKTNNRENTSRCPKYIKGYRLVNPLRKIHGKQKYAIGVYEKQNKRFFIKTWHGNTKDLSYYTLFQEYIKTRNLWQAFARLPKKSAVNISIPEPIECIAEKNRLSVVSAYIPGTSLTSLSIASQARHMHHTLAKIPVVGRILSTEEKGQFPKRTGILYLLLVPFFTLRALIVHPKYSKTIIASALHSFLLAPNRLLEPLVLAHRDLLPENMILKGNRVFVLDWAYAGFTPPGYDFTNLTIARKYRTLSTHLQTRFGRRADRFLTGLISLQHVPFFGPKPEINHYLHALQ